MYSIARPSVALNSSKWISSSILPFRRSVCFSVDRPFTAAPAAIRRIHSTQINILSIVRSNFPKSFSRHSISTNPHSHSHRRHCFHSSTFLPRSVLSIQRGGKFFVAVGASLLISYYFLPTSLSSDSQSYSSSAIESVNNDSEAPSLQASSPSCSAAEFGSHEILQFSSIFSRISYYFHVLIRLPTLFILYFPLLLLYPILDSHCFNRLLLLAISSSGPIFIKFGQWAATRSDLFSPDLISMLSRLHVASPPHSLAYSKQVVERDFGDAILISTGELIGSGSMGQVHRAVKSADSTPVVVKVLHPGLFQRISVDCFYLRLFAKFLNSLPLLNFEFLALPDTVNEFQRFILSHADLHCEANNLLEFGRNFQDFPGIHFPQPIPPFVSNSSLVEEIANGISIDKFLDSNPPLAHRQSLARIGLRMFLTMLVKHNFLHSDLHPGNLLVGIKNFPQKPSAEEIAAAKPDELELIVIDCALVTRLSQQNRENFLSLFAALLNGDGILAAKLMKENAKFQRVQNDSLYENEMREIVETLPIVRLNALNFGSLMNRVTSLVRRHGVRLESDFATLIVSLALIEGIAKRLDANLSFARECAPILAADEEARNIILNKCGMETINKLVSELI